MGYTHYLKKTKNETKKEWNAFKRTLKKCFKILQSQDELDPLDFTDQSGEVPIATANMLFSRGQNVEFLLFNGFGDDFFEDFYLQHRGELGFNFCKTNRNEYDFFVMITILCIKLKMPNSFKLSSDGTTEDWLPAYSWFKENITDKDVSIIN